ncbi:uncharacterized protein LOC110908036 isoform X2 [Helianthus annuus]|uniref:uncharacterized protein LOC110908004 isoform X2 n=1 Tax=Helianthus annuus TaxID=4232 RepID=UPI0016530CD3|nr:uncharacterized protein LOC110908004 isoform X2 [Helianthus annuus]XP_035838651.1 uncharacterized protein LOC110908036 isoform X2 [Helianthus annuus]
MESPSTDNKPNCKCSEGWKCTVTKTEPSQTGKPFAKCGGSGCTCVTYICSLSYVRQLWCNSHWRSLQQPKHSVSVVKVGLVLYPKPRAPMLARNTLSAVKVASVS